MEKIMEPLLIGKLKHINDYHLQLWVQARGDIQVVLNAYKKTGLAALSNDEFPQLFNDADSLLYDKITGGGNTHVSTTGGGHIAINKTAAMAIMQKPVGYQELRDAIKNYVGNGSKFYKHSLDQTGFSVAELGKYFVLDNAGDVQYSDEHLFTLNEKGKMYITKESGVDTYKFTQDIAAAFFYNNMDKHLNYKGSITTEALSEFLDKVMRGIDYETCEPIVRYRIDGGGYFGDHLK